MKKFSDLNWLKLLSMLFILIMVFSTLPGCSSRYTTRTVVYKTYKGKLSDAMNKATDDHKGKREVETSHEPRVKVIEVHHYCPDDYQTDGNTTNEKTISRLDPNRSSKNWNICAMGGTGLLRGNDFYGLNHFNLSLGGYQSDYDRVEFIAGFGYAPLQETGKLHKSLKDGVILLNAGVLYKRFMTPRHTFLGPYFILGLDVNHMFWSYNHPIQFDGETIYSDGVGGLGLYAGIGFNIIQVPHVQVGGEVLPGAIFWSDETSEGFDNDVFGAFWNIRFRLTFSILSR